jgi:hypothetical protein
LLYQPGSWQEYYYGLFIYLLGSLRFGDLDRMATAPRPKQLAFWGAASILDLMENEPDCSQFSGQRAVATPAAAVPKSVTTGGRGAEPGWDIDKIVADWQTDALNQRLALFNILKAEFSMHELNQELAFGLGIDLDDLPSSGKSEKPRS